MTSSAFRTSIASCKRSLLVQKQCERLRYSRPLKRSTAYYFWSWPTRNATVHPETSLYSVLEHGEKMLTIFSQRYRLVSFHIALACKEVCPRRPFGTSCSFSRSVAKFVVTTSTRCLQNSFVRKIMHGARTCSSRHKHMSRFHRQTVESSCNPIACDVTSVRDSSVQSMTHF